MPEGARHYDFGASPWLMERAETVYRLFMMSLGMEGDVAECGVYQGHTSRNMVGFLECIGVPKVLHMFDSFQGLPGSMIDEERAVSKDGSDWADLGEGAMACSESAVRHFMRPYTRFEIHPGFFCETLPQFDGPLCFIHADADMYVSTVEIIQFADRVLVPGGVVVFDDYGSEHFPGVKIAVMQFLDLTQYEFYPIDGARQGMAIKRGGDPALRPVFKLIPRE